MNSTAALASGVAAAVLVCAGLPARAQTEATYDRVDEVMDWGATTTKLIVDLGTEVPSGALDADSFSVTVRRSDPRLQEPLIEEGGLDVTEAYVSDAEGNEVEAGRYATLVPEIGPTVTLSQALNYAADPDAGRDLNAWTRNEYTITQAKPIGDVEGLIATQMDRYLRPLIDRFEFASATYEDADYGTIELNYAHFVPEADDGANPLIVWLHGGGEGGTDPTIPLAPNRADRFASDEIQGYFGGAYVLVPQSPTAWMHGPAGVPDGVGKPDALSIYTRATQDLVEGFVAGQPDIDTGRIYVGGLSNGGFLTLRLILDYPDYYAAALPVCEPLNLDYVSEEELKRIVDMPIWIVTAATDEIVEAEQFPVPLYDRLQRLGADNVHLSYLPRVVDMTGAYKAEDGSPHEYNGHFSWIPVYNNHLAYIEGGGGQIYGPVAQEADTVAGREVVTVMEWLAAQSK
jgi:predicted peptidase